MSITPDEKSKLIRLQRELRELNLQHGGNITLNSLFPENFSQSDRKRPCSMCYKASIPSFHISFDLSRSGDFCNRCINLDISKLKPKKTVQISANTCCDVCGKNQSRNTDFKEFQMSNRYSQSFRICNSCEEGKISVDKISDEMEELINYLNERENKSPSEKANSISLKEMKKSIISTYVEAGLDEVFAKAIVNNEHHETEILNLWDADWWKQYPVDDVLVRAVLEGKLSESSGEWVNSIRSDHMILALAIIEGEVDINWWKAILDSGFNKYPEAVIDVLKGAKPETISRIRKLDIDRNLLPPYSEVFINVDHYKTKIRNLRKGGPKPKKLGLPPGPKKTTQNKIIKQPINTIRMTKQQKHHFIERILSKLKVYHLEVIFDEGGHGDRLVKKLRDYLHDNIDNKDSEIVKRTIRELESAGEKEIAAQLSIR